MVRLLGNNLANKKRIYIALTAIYGIGISKSLTILKNVQIDPNIQVFNLSEHQISSLRDALESGNMKFEGDLKRQTSQHIKRLIDINSFRGRRHLKGLPVRGQRTRTNSRTSRRQARFIKKP